MSDFISHGELINLAGVDKINSESYFRQCNFENFVAVSCGTTQHCQFLFSISDYLIDTIF